jgi:glycosyltransferase involved in cell wall biosynthesis
VDERLARPVEDEAPQRDPAARRRVITYVLPIRRPCGAGVPPRELTDYLRHISRVAELIVVDGSEPVEFAAANVEWRTLATHIPPDVSIAGRNGKVRGVLTGLRYASNDAVVLADDDVRYDDDSLHRVANLLAGADIVVPQNHFEPRPWHVVWDTSRTLVNRAFGFDFPGTLAVRRDAVLAAGGYDADVLFENLELIRTVQAARGRVVAPRDLYVRRLPPSSRRFLEQRVRQAYDDLARPARFAIALSVVPFVIVARRRPWLNAAAATAAVVVAELGRRRGGGRSRFAPVSTAIAPLWWLERSVCSWIALGFRLSGGCPYAGRRLLVAAHSRRALARRRAAIADTNAFGRGSDRQRSGSDREPDKETRWHSTHWHRRGSPSRSSSRLSRR